MPEPIEILSAAPDSAADAPQATGGCGGGGGGGSCGCGGGAAKEDVVLDVRSIPHAVRHGAVFGALASVSAGESLVLVAPHDPLPLLAQLDAREPGAFSRAYVAEGPEAWAVRLTRTA